MSSDLLRIFGGGLESNKVRPLPAFMVVSAFSVVIYLPEVYSKLSPVAAANRVISK
ncbi:MAG: hypothetical protein LBK18_06605 [Prevotellaceae bacterium]|nr:hypothetical protein [Prevotellaceae bacterium]